MTFTPELYKALVEKMPELEVPGLYFNSLKCDLCCGDCPSCCRPLSIDEHHARAIITAYWLECLPQQHFVAQCSGAPGRWFVDPYVGYSSTPLDALADYWADRLGVKA